MHRLDGGTFTMGSDRFYPEEAPPRRIAVAPFWVDETPVTNRQFARFVDETGYRTVAEIPPSPKDYPGMDPAQMHAASLVFHKTRGPVDLDDSSAWWSFQPGASWRHPLGPESTIDDLLDHPVVHVSHIDAAAYAAWAGKRLPSEAEWEFAAQGGHDDRDYAWGDALAPGGTMMANYWQGLFPFANTQLDGWERTSPVRTYPANDYGLFDMIGNVWEWTDDWWALPAGKKPKKGGQSCCGLPDPRGGSLKGSFDPLIAQVRIGRKVIKGGSHLCAENYCQRYRPAARHPQTIETSTGHIGFRCVVREADLT
ncbi:formylglycine-generating enzyme family protein [Novosphingobium sp. RD2P27]|uniref:Formylglycine-generating enzyme family protein n=2 Tax=Novosphingobium kalidii TaxID=3230299 RepID=A0ABV2D1J2_9SPHN